jgi:hypothetical protein
MLRYETRENSFRQKYYNVSTKEKKKNGGKKLKNTRILI